MKKITRIIARFAKWPLATITLSTALLCQGVQAQDDWNSGNTGNWEDGANWFIGTPPSAGSFVVIEEGHATLSSDAGAMDFLFLASSRPEYQATLTLNGPNAALAVGFSYLGFEGDATLEVLDGALFSTPSGVFNVGGDGGGADILLSGTAGRRGTLEVSNISQSADSSGAFLTFDGGVLRAAATGSSDILRNWGEDVTLNAGGAFIDSNGRDIALDARLVSTGALTKQGAGSLTLEGSNTYSGGTVIEVGSLQVGAGGTTGVLGTGNITNEASLIFNRSNTLTVDNQISGSGSVTQAGSGTTILTGSNSYTGGTTIEDGILQIGTGGTSGSLGSANITNNASLVFDRSNNLTVANQISGSGTLTQAGSGTLTLTGTNTYSGGTSITGGTLAVSSDANLGHSDADISIEGGTLRATTSFASGRDIAVDGISSTISTDAGVTLSINGSITANGGGPNVLRKSGSGVLELNAANTQSSTNLQEGTLALNHSQALGTGLLNMNLSNTSLRLGDGVNINNDININSSGRALYVAVGDTATFSGSLFGMNGISDDFSKTGGGTLIFTDDSENFTADIQINAGRFQVGAGGTSGRLAPSVGVDIDNNASLAFSRSDDMTVGNVITGDGSLVQMGSGTTTLTGANTYSGDTTVSGGTLVVNGSVTSAVTVQAGGTLGGSGSVGAVTNAGTLAPGNTPETLNVAGDLILDPISILDFELDTPDVVGGGVNDLIEVNGNLTLDGTLDIIDWGNYGAGTYRLINYTGTLTDNGLNIGTQPAGFTAVLDLSVPNEVNLIVTVNANDPTGGTVHALPVFNLPGLVLLALLLVASGMGRLRIRSRI